MDEFGQNGMYIQAGWGVNRLSTVCVCVFCFLNIYILFYGYICQDAELLGEYKTIATTINDKALLYLVESPTVVWTEFSTDVSQHALGGSGQGNAHAVVLLKMPDKTLHVFNPDAKCPTRVNYVSPSGLRQFLLKFNNWRVVWHAGPGSSANLDCRDQCLAFLQDSGFRGTGQVLRW